MFMFMILLLLLLLLMLMHMLTIYGRPTRSSARTPTSTTSTCPLLVCLTSHLPLRSSSSAATALPSRRSEYAALSPPTMA